MSDGSLPAVVYVLGALRRVKQNYRARESQGWSLAARLQPRNAGGPERDRPAG